MVVVVRLEMLVELIVVMVFSEIVGILLVVKVESCFDVSVVYCWVVRLLICVLLRVLICVVVNFVMLVELIVVSC